MSDLPKALVLDYVEQGLAEKESETSLRSLDGKNTVELQSVGEPDAIGMSVFINGHLAETLFYEDRDFNQKLIQLLSEPLDF